MTERRKILRILPPKYLDALHPDNTKRACTILLLAKKIIFFISIPGKHLAISVN
jgi:hypothetical protein